MISLTDRTVAPVTLVGGGPGAWDLITVRGMHALQNADVILTDHLGPGAFLDKLCDVAGKEIIDVAKIPYQRQVAQEETNRIMIERARAGQSVARLKGGDPFVFGRGSEEVRALAQAGIPCTVVPGVTSAIAVPAAAGVPVTERGVVHSFSVVSGHLPPGDPRSLVDWEALARAGGTICVIMGVRTIASSAAALVAAGLSAQTPVCAITEGTLPSERCAASTLGQLRDHGAGPEIVSPAVFVIGEVARQAAAQ
ncbi:uroporphyrinogen-III C-methyltransferase [Corynebacterium atypicum]|uniref:uroporphyrinogen-III C-methyltransferase n=1 Tax=Corynebacterium atypicum TaxID=191610 RepID=UPI00068C15EF|nr:uroporphyrinogen-III C-methyltransferase [Corynebacterium atypicum]